MTKLINLNLDNKAVKYTDGKSVEKKMFEFVKGKNVTFNKNEQWPYIYHFSKHREGILSWYPFKKNCTILEIGSGCGAITNLLCRKAKYVTSIELEYNRAIINYERHKKINNLEIIIGDINNINLNKKYDYVILNGVLEYANYILKENDAYTKLLKKSKSFLKENGTILLAIENRLGLKYLAGNKEDHLGTIYSGINGYKNSDIKTFSKYELIKLIRKSGYTISKWYYPYPDYKFPFEIFTDKTINNIYPTSINLPLDYDQIQLFDMNNLYKSLMKDKIMQYFSNSFLVEINNDRKSKNFIDYVKLSSIRNNKFSITTTLDFSHNKVTKTSNYKEGNTHIKNISNNNFSNNLFETLKYDYSSNKVTADLINYDNLLNEVINNNHQLVPIIEKIYDSLCTTNAEIRNISNSFINVFGNVSINKPLHWIKNANIDLTLNNVYEQNGKYIVIDPEWQFNFYIPAEYIIWRILFYLPQNGICNRNDIYKKLKIFGINKSMCDTFKKMELNFIFKYIGYKELPYKNTTYIDLNKRIV